MNIDSVLAGFHYALKLKLIQKVIGYCKKNDINYKSMSFVEFINVNTKFLKWEWISLEYLKSLLKHKPFNLEVIKTDTEDKYLKLLNHINE